MKRRIQQLEEHVYSNNNDGSESDDIGYLKSKLRDASEQFKELESKVDDLELKVETVDATEDIRDDIKDLKRQISSRHDEIQDDIKTAEHVLSQANEYINQIVEERNRIHDRVEDLELMVTEFNDKMRNVKEQVTRGSNTSTMAQAALFAAYFPDCEKVDQLFELLHEAAVRRYDVTRELSNIVSEYVEIAQRDYDIDVEDNEAFFYAYISHRADYIAIEEDDEMNIDNMQVGAGSQIEGGNQQSVFEYLDKEFGSSQATEALKRINHRQSLLMDSVDAATMEEIESSVYDKYHVTMVPIMVYLEAAQREDNFEGLKKAAQDALDQIESFVHSYEKRPHIKTDSLVLESVHADSEEHDQ